ncbi:hypothetical protein JVT61DRAFT_9882 [Boletus reticuloceps]|uniref:Uncharacterized protein n=1 Tax=Boletus reticuloceps TaxID=495285 RepID=A0A8I2YFW2_9AGAM|nr:hypothetical protein JVT61DRAFT_9882 [Boletus reticuloceps]
MSPAPQFTPSQVHTCKPRRCIVHDKHGNYYCKQHAPFPTSSVDSIDETGNWQIARQYEYLNGFVPHLAVNARCNNDAKLLTNGRDTLNVAFYVTSYQTKKQGRKYNSSAVMAKTFQYHSQDVRNATIIRDLRDQQHLLLFCILHAMNREQELAAPMVVSYLMGWGDVICSHHYTNVYWSSFVAALLNVFHKLCCQSPSAPGDGEPVNHSQRCSYPVECSSENLQHSSLLNVDKEGKFTVKKQVTDYCCRGEELGDYNIVHFFKETYEERIAQSRKAQPDHEQPESVDDEDDSGDRQRQPRSRYLPTHPKFDAVRRVVRVTGHNTLPNFIGPWFPWKDNDVCQDYYFASMFMLFRPWRNLNLDLKHDQESWGDAFKRMEETMNMHDRRMLGNIQYYYQCKEATDSERSTEIPQERDEDQMGEPIHALWVHVVESMLTIATADAQEDVEDELSFTSPNVDQETIHGRLAVEAGMIAGIFAEEYLEDQCYSLQTTCSRPMPSFRHATKEDEEFL